MTDHAEQTDIHAHTLEVPVDSLHPDWQGDWCRSITSPRNREALAGNPRLSGRISRDIIATLSGGEIDPSLLTKSDLFSYQTILAQPERMKTLIGIANHGHLLFDMVGGPQVRKLAEKLDMNDLRLALSAREFVPRDTTTRLDIDRLGEAIDSSGTRSLIDWSATLPRPFSTRLKLLLAKKSLFDSPRSSSDNHSLSRLVYHIAEQVARQS